MQAESRTSSGEPTPSVVRELFPQKRERSGSASSSDDDDGHKVKRARSEPDSARRLDESVFTPKCEQCQSVFGPGLYPVIPNCGHAIICHICSGSLSGSCVGCKLPMKEHASVMSLQLARAYIPEYIRNDEALLSAELRKIEGVISRRDGIHGPYQPNPDHANPIGAQAAADDARFIANVEGMAKLVFSCDESEEENVRKLPVWFDRRVVLECSKQDSPVLAAAVVRGSPSRPSTPLPLRL